MIATQFILMIILQSDFGIVRQNLVFETKKQCESAKSKGIKSAIKQKYWNKMLFMECFEVPK